MSSFLEDPLRVARLADVIDVLLVALLFFVALTWLRGSQSGSAARRLLALVFLYAVLYLVVDAYNLYLMTRVLGVLFFVVLIALVVIFQRDIRRMLDRIATWSLYRRASDAEGSPTDALKEAVAELAEGRTGALIAIRGEEPWESYVQGGVELDGHVSAALLQSIFEPGSPGHDGAVLLEGARVSRFGVHLPLARRLPEASRTGGTRHAAGLGLAEQCDALVIVVSEERGTISVAQDGELTEMTSPAELGERLDRFWQDHYEEPTEGRRRWWSRRALETAFASLGLAVLTWFLFVYSGDTVQRTYRVPIEIRNLPADWRLENDTVPSALVTLSGSAQAFERVSPADLVVSFDLSAPEPGPNELTITRDRLPLPSGVNLADADPPEVTVRAVRQALVELPVRVRTTGELPDTLTLAAEPSTVRVLVPVGTDPPAEVPTRPLDLARLDETGSITARLALPRGLRLAPDQEGEVEVRLRRRAAPPLP